MEPDEPHPIPIDARVQRGSPRPSGTPLKYAHAYAGTAEVTVYEAQTTPGLVIVDVDPYGQDVRVYVNDELVWPKEDP